MVGVSDESEVRCVSCFNESKYQIHGAIEVCLQKISATVICLVSCK